MDASLQEKYNRFRDRFRRMTDAELFDEYENDRSKTGWTSSRSYFYAALHDEFKARNIPYPG